VFFVAAFFSSAGKLRPTETPARAQFASTAQVIQPETRVLPDGSIVELKRGAVIDVHFSDTLRAIALRQGEAHFEVKKDAARPFVVTAGSVEFRAVGTAFAVQLGQSEVELIVTHGIVAVEKPLKPATAQRPTHAMPATAQASHTLATVDAGKRMVLDLAPTAVHSSPVLAAIDADEMAQRLAWRATRLEFTGTRLADAVELMSRHNAVRFVIADAALRDLEVTGFFRADNVDAFLLLLEGSFGANVERSGNTITLRRSP
jgi:transmembrane sensor